MATSDDTTQAWPDSLRSGLSDPGVMRMVPARMGKAMQGRHEMASDRICSRCGGVDEFVYEINWEPVFYCATCDVQSTSSHELCGPDEKAVDDAGE